MRVAAIGQAELIQGFGLAGASLLPAGDAAGALAAWDALAGDVELLLLTPDAVAALRHRLEAATLLWVEIPA